MVTTESCTSENRAALSHVKKLHSSEDLWLFPKLLGASHHHHVIELCCKELSTFTLDNPC